MWFVEYLFSVCEAIASIPIVDRKGEEQREGKEREWRNGWECEMPVCLRSTTWAGSAILSVFVRI